MGWMPERHGEVKRRSGRTYPGVRPMRPKRTGIRRRKGEKPMELKGEQTRCVGIKNILEETISKTPMAPSKQISAPCCRGIGGVKKKQA